MPVEDVSVEWDEEVSKPIPDATLTIGVQDVDSTKGRALAEACETMAFCCRFTCSGLISSPTVCPRSARWWAGRSAAKGALRWTRLPDGWAGGGMWIWTVVGILVMVLLVVVILKLSKK
jgi:hypothetical protein